MTQTQTRSEPLTQADIRRHSQLLAAKQPDRMEELLRDVGMSEAAIEAVMPQALANLAVRMDGIEMLLRRWTARPQVASEEATGFFTVLDDAVAEQTQATVDDLLAQRKRADTRGQQLLDAWNSRRKATQPLPETAKALVLADKRKGSEEWEKDDLGDGAFIFRYTPKPNPVDVAEQERIRRERLARQQRQKGQGE